METAALITGASDGLGKAFAIHCAQKGMNLILVALPDSGLKALGNLLKENFPIEVYLLELDLTQEESCQRLLSFVYLENISVQLLINNAGLGGTFEFAKEDFDIFDKMILLNIRAFTMITHGLIPVLSKQPKSYILNVASMAGVFAAPYKQVYGATKLYINFFSKCLRFELQHRNIQISVLCPAGILSNIKQRIIHNSCNSFQRLTFVDPEEVAEYALKQCLKGKSMIIPGKLVRICFYLTFILPPFVKNYLSNLNNQKLIRAQESMRIQQSKIEEKSKVFEIV